MKNIFQRQWVFALFLIGLSVTFYGIHYAIFRDSRNIFYYLVLDIAFLFLNVLIMVLVLNRLIEFREKQNILRKLNMAVSAFFSELGRDLLGLFLAFDKDIDKISQKLSHPGTWKEPDFAKIKKEIPGHVSGINSATGDLEGLKRLLTAKRQFLLNLLQNQNLLEHESFTDMLWAIFHLTDELEHRKEIRNLHKADYKHLTGDMNRAYLLLIVQWVDYIKHLSQDYPYLYSLAVRTNPFDNSASVEIRQ